MKSRKLNQRIDRQLLFDKCLPEFLLDLDFVDIKKDLTDNQYLSEEECQLISNEGSQEEQVERLIFLLVYDQRKSIEGFMEVLARYYLWLAKVVEENLRINAPPDKEITSCVCRAWMPPKGNVLVHRTDLVSHAVRVDDRFYCKVISCLTR